MNCLFTYGRVLPKSATVDSMPKKKIGIVDTVIIEYYRIMLLRCNAELQNSKTSSYHIQALVGTRWKMLNTLHNNIGATMLQHWKTSLWAATLKESTLNQMQEAKAELHYIQSGARFVAPLQIVGSCLIQMMTSAWGSSGIHVTNSFDSQVLWQTRLRRSSQHLGRWAVRQDATSGPLRDTGNHT